MFDPQPRFFSVVSLLCAGACFERDFGFCAGGGEPEPILYVCSCALAQAVATTAAHKRRLYLTDCFRNAPPLPINTIRVLRFITVVGRWLAYFRWSWRLGKQPSRALDNP